MKRLLAVLAVSIFAGSVLGERYIGTGNATETNNRERVFLGGMFPIHQNDNNECGGILDLGVQRQEAMVFAVNAINNNPDILPGITLAFDIRDTCARTNKALEESLDFVSPSADVLIPYDDYNSFFTDGSGDGDIDVYGISGVVGAASSGVSIAVANLLRLFHIPQVSYASTAKILSDKTRFDYFFRTLPPDSLQARAMADIVAHFNWTYVVAIHTNDAYGSEGIQAFFDELEQLELESNATHICVAKNIELSLTASEEDFDKAVAELDEEWIRNASVIVLFGQLATAEGILDAVARRKQTNVAFAERSLTWIGSDAWGDQLSIKQHHSIAQGMISVIPQSNMSEEFDEYFQSLNPSTNSANPWFVEYWEYLFNCSFSNNSTFSPCDPATENISFETGYRQNSKVPFVIDAVYSFALAIHQLQRDHCTGDGICTNIIESDDRSGVPLIDGELLLQYLHNVSFHGVSAKIKFNSQGDQEGGYSIKNLCRTQTGYRFKTVGSWNGGNKQLVIEQEHIRWSQSVANVPLSVCSLPCGGGEYPEQVPGQAGCCWICRPCKGIKEISLGEECIDCDQGFLPNGNRTECVEIPLTFLTWSSPWSIVILTLTCAGLIAASFVAAVFIVFNRNEIIKASSRELSAVLLGGLLLCYFLPFFFIAMPSTPICVIRRFGVGFCFAVCYSALLVKANRMHRIFNRNWGNIQKPPLISPQSQLLFTFMLVLVQVVIAIVWLVVERPGITYIYDTFSTELRCNESPHIGLSVTLGYNLLLLLLSTYYAFRTRKIPQNFNEAKFINLTLYTLCIIWVAFIPTYFATAKLGAVYQTSSQVIAIILSATTTLCCLFFPKVYILFSRTRKEYLSSSNHNTECSQQYPMYHHRGSIGSGSGERRKSDLLSSFGSVTLQTQNSRILSPNDFAPMSPGVTSPLTPNSSKHMALHKRFSLPILREEDDNGSTNCNVTPNTDQNQLCEQKCPTLEQHSVTSDRPKAASSSTGTQTSSHNFVYLLSLDSHHLTPVVSTQCVDRGLLYQHIPLPLSNTATPYGSSSSLYTDSNEK